MDSQNTDNTEFIPSTIYVSLYIFLLIFFVLLNSVSKSNQVAAEKALDSIKKTFSNKSIFPYLSDTPNNKLSQLELREMQNEYYRRTIINNLSDKFQQLSIDKNDHSNILKLSIDLTTVFYQNSDLIRNQQEEIFTQISKIINKDNKLRVEVTIGTNLENGLNIETVPEITNLRILSIYRIFLKNQVNEKSFLVGIDKSRPRAIIFSFFFKED